MHTSVDHYTLIEPLRYIPTFLQNAHKLAEVTGSVGSAVAVLFRSAGIRVRVVGDATAWSNPGVGTLFIGDHRSCAEFAPLLAIFGGYGRDDVHLVAKPFSTNARIIHSFGHHAEGMVLPVIPRTLARDRQNIWNRDLGWRLKNVASLPTVSELSAANAAVIHRAASLVSAGHVVNIYPAGGIMDAGKHPWQRGVGKIIKSLPPESIETTHVVLYRFDDFSVTRIICSLFMCSHGLTPTPYEMTLRIGPHGTLPQLLAGIGILRHLDANELTARLRQQFIERFGGKPLTR